jgi:SAM-dependent methyltransferase
MYLSSEGQNMGSRKSGDFFDAHYYATGCGRPYQRDEEWLSFFGSIADRIVNDIRPATVLDAGCAMGFLVEALRQRGVEAFGVDVSEYAIQNAHSSVQSYCRKGSITQAFPRTYDLIVSIEVLEHLYPNEAEPAVANLCRHADDILFSSTPFDRAEATHFNVQPVEYWVELFARCGFFRAVDFDASFITPWAMRFRRARQPVSQVIAAYERRLWKLQQENQAGRQACIELDDREKQMQALNAQLSDLTARQAVLEASTGWALLKRLQRWRARLAPPGSRRDRWLDVALRRLDGIRGQSSE